MQLTKISNNIYVLVLLLLILAVSLLLRFYGLEKQSLWHDELLSWQQSDYASLPEVIVEGVRPDVHPPGYQLFLYFIMRYAGDDETILRMPSAICGVLSVLVIFLLGRRLYSSREGLIASAFMAVLYFPIYYSQEARAYSMLLLFALLTTYLWVWMLEDLNRRSRPPLYVALGYIVTAIVSSYLHYFGLFLVGLQGIGMALFFVRRREALICISLIYSPIVLAYLPWLQDLLKDLSGDTTTWIESPSALAFAEYLGYSFNKSRILLLLVAILWLFLLYDVYNTWRAKEYNGVRATLLAPATLLVLWLLIPFSIVYLKSLLSTPILSHRNLIISLPAVYLLLARSITRLPIGAKGQGAVALVVTGLFLSHLVFGMNYYSEPSKEQFREAVGFVIEHNHLYKNSLIAGCDWDGTLEANQLESLNYYFEHGNTQDRVDISGCNEQGVSNVRAAMVANRPSYVWYVNAHRPPNKKLVDYLSKSATLLVHKEWYGAQVWLFETKDT